VSPHDHAARHDPIYDHLSEQPEFGRLRHLYRRFIIPATAVFMGWYALYVVMSMFAPDFMGKVLWGNINVALVFGLLQFVTTFGIAYLYSQYSNKHLDPLARQLNEAFDSDRAGRGITGSPRPGHEHHDGSDL
jgi:uncharacterized membrane protein (DUF485 family)